MSGRLRSSVTYTVANGNLTIGTNVVYAAVHQFGSADRRGGSVGAQAKIPGRASKVSSYDYMRAMPYRRKDLRGGKVVKGRGIGPEQARRTTVREHGRHQRRFVESEHLDGDALPRRRDEVDHRRDAVIGHDQDSGDAVQQQRCDDVAPVAGEFRRSDITFRRTNNRCRTAWKRVPAGAASAAKGPMAGTRGVLPVSPARMPAG